MAETDQRDKGLVDELPLDRLKDAGQDLLEAVVSRAVGSLTGKVSGLTDRLTGVADNGGSGLTAALTGAKDLAEGKSPLKSALGAGIAGAKDKVKQAVSGGGGSGGSSDAKVVNIIEEFDVGIPLRVAYNQWTTFEDFPSFTRKVEKVEQESDEKINWRAQIFFSHRDWESTIIEQVPDERIVWKSTGAKGYVDGAVTFHELAPTMTRILLVLEYYPQGFFEKTANLWRAQGRRVRSDFKHIKRHMMTRTILDQDEAEGWRGEIRDEEVVKTHEDALDEEDKAGETEEGDETDETEAEEEEAEEEEERVPAQESRSR